MASGPFKTTVTITLIIDPAGTVPLIWMVIFWLDFEQLEVLVMLTEHVALGSITESEGNII